MPRKKSAAKKKPAARTTRAAPAAAAPKPQPGMVRRLAMQYSTFQADQPLHPHTDLTHAMRETICMFIAMGVSPEAAATQQGVSTSTWYYWKRRGRAAIDVATTRARDDGDHTQWVQCVDEPELPYALLIAGIDQAEGRAETGFTLQVAKASERDWKAAAWWLERRRGGLYGSKDTIRIEQDPGTMSNEAMIAELNELGFVQAAVIQAPANDGAHHLPHDVARLDGPGAGDGLTNGRGGEAE